VAEACECGNEPSGSVKCGEFMTSCKPGSFSRRTLHNGVSKLLAVVDMLTVHVTTSAFYQTHCRIFERTVLEVGMESFSL